MAEVVRIDRFLWAIRAYKTRSEATDACKGNKVKVAGCNAKPSKMIKIGDVIELRKGSVLYSYKVKSILSNRVGAKLVSEYVENLTPQSELDKLKVPVETFVLKRERGAGRPTKKDRREMDAMWENVDYGDMDDIPDDIAIRFGIYDNDDIV